MSIANGHAARMSLGANARGKAALETLLSEAMDLLGEIAFGGWENEEQAQDWAKRYEDLAARVK